MGYRRGLRGDQDGFEGGEGCRCGGRKNAVPLCVHARGVDDLREEDGEEENLERLKDLERMMQHRVRTHEKVPPRTPVELRTFVVRVYPGGPDADEVSRPTRIRW